MEWQLPGQIVADIGLERPPSEYIDGSITLKTFEKAARALNCTLVYALVPDESLETAVHKRAMRPISGK